MSVIGYHGAMTTEPNNTTGDTSDALAKGAIDDSQLPEDLRPESTELLDNAQRSESPSGAQAPDDSGLSDNQREHAGQVSEPTTEMAPQDDPGVAEPTG